MSQFQTYRVLVRKSDCFHIDLPARDENGALSRAERLWYGRQRERFSAVVGHEPEVFEIDEIATAHLSDVANEDRAQWAEKALKTFSRETGSDMGPEALHDLLCDLGHYADQLGLDFEDAMRRAAETWAEEKAEQQGAQP